MTPTKIVTAQIQSGEGPDADWRPDTWHGVARAQVGDDKLWWYQGVEGIQVLGELGPRRTVGEPVTLRRVDQAYGTLIFQAANAIGPLWNYPGVDQLDQHAARRLELEILLASVITTESDGNPKAERFESFGDASFGLCQTLTATALNLWLQHKDRPFVGRPPSMPLTAGGFHDIEEAKESGLATQWREFLFEPANSILLCALLLHEQNARFDLRGDPVFHYACYNAGSPRPSQGNPWGLVYYRKEIRPGEIVDAMNNFVSWYGDACAVLNLRDDEA